MSTDEQQLRMQRHGVMAMLFDLIAVHVCPMVDQRMTSRFGSDWPATHPPRVGYPNRKDPITALRTIQGRSGSFDNLTEDAKRAAGVLADARNAIVHHQRISTAKYHKIVAAARTLLLAVGVAAADIDAVVELSDTTTLQQALDGLAARVEEERRRAEAAEQALQQEQTQRNAAQSEAEKLRHRLAQAQPSAGTGTAPVVTTPAVVRPMSPSNRAAVITPPRRRRRRGLAVVCCFIAAVVAGPRVWRLTGDSPSSATTGYDTSADRGPSYAAATPTEPSTTTTVKQSTTTTVTSPAASPAPRSTSTTGTTRPAPIATTTTTNYLDYYKTGTCRLAVSPDGDGYVGRITSDRPYSDVVFQQQMRDSIWGKNYGYSAQNVRTDGQGNATVTFGPAGIPANALEVPDSNTYDVKTSYRDPNFGVLAPCATWSYTVQYPKPPSTPPLQTYQCHAAGGELSGDSFTLDSDTTYTGAINRPEVYWYSPGPAFTGTYRYDEAAHTFTWLSGQFATQQWTAKYLGNLGTRLDPSYEFELTHGATTEKCY